MTQNRGAWPSRGDGTAWFLWVFRCQMMVCGSGFASLVSNDDAIALDSLAVRFVRDSPLV